MPSNERANGDWVMPDNPPTKTGLGGVPRELDRPEEIRPPLRTYVTVLALLGTVTAMASYHYAVRGFRRQPVEDRFVVPAADPDRGRMKLREYGCAGCHTVPGVPGASGRVGPRLDRLREQAYIAGVLPNSPQNMVTWIQRPQEVDPRTAMPNLDVTAEDARDIAAYLYAIP